MSQIIRWQKKVSLSHPTKASKRDKPEHFQYWVFTSSKTLNLLFPKKLVFAFPENSTPSKNNLKPTRLKFYIFNKLYKTIIEFQKFLKHFKNFSIAPVQSESLVTSLIRVLSLYPGMWQGIKTFLVSSFVTRRRQGQFFIQGTELL